MAVDVDGTNALLARAARSAIVGPTNATSHCRKCNVATEGRDDYHAPGRGGRVPPTAPWLRGLVAPPLQRTRTAAPRALRARAAPDVGAGPPSASGPRRGAGGGAPALMT